MTTRLFVYGTLAPECAPASLADVVARFRLLGSATLYGRLFSLGAYPGMVCDPADRSRVHGRVFEIAANDTAYFDPDLKRLDAYERFFPHDPATSLFCRVMCEVMMEDGPTRAWTYVYNRDVTGADLIATGVWTRGAR